jgi:plastocyanin
VAGNRNIQTRNRSRRIAAAIVLLASVTLLGACGGDDKGGDASDSTGSEVTIKLISFRPGTLTVAPGTTVTWKNTDASAHTVTSGTVQQGGAGVTTKPDGGFDSTLAKDKTFSHTFDKPGTYSYFCNIHPATMRGEIVVR